MIADVAVPVEDPILIFALAMIIFLVAPLLLERYRLPGIIGIILVGAAIGPNGVGLLDRDETFILLGEVGLVYLMFIAGLEINVNRFIEHKDRSIVFGVFSFVIPQVTGTVVGLAVFDFTIPAALLFGAIVSSHTLLAYPVVTRLGIATNEAITATIGGTIFTDTLALLVLAIVVAAAGGVLGATFWAQLVIGLILFFVGVWVLVPRLARWFFRSVDQASYVNFLFVMAVLFVCAYLAEFVGVKHIIGAFLAGLTLNRLIPKTGPLMNRIEFVGNALFIPFFLISVGMLVDGTVLFAGLDTIAIAVALLVVVLGTKYAAAWATGAIYAYDRYEVLGMYGLSMGQAAAALAIVLIGFEENIPGFDQHLINAVVLMILVISLLSPAIVERAGTTIRRAADHEAYDPRDSPRRILVPFSRQSQYKDELLLFALLLRGSRSTEPLYTVSVVEPDTAVEAEVAEVETALADMEMLAAGAGVAVQSRVQVDPNPATGIVRAVVENRITTLVIGWDGARSRRQTVFGSTIDQVLRQTDRLIFVTRAREPLPMTARVVVILPPGIDRSPGFYEAIHHVKLIAEQTEVAVHYLAVDGSPVEFDRLIDSVDPEVTMTGESLDGWGAVRTALRETIGPDDFVICLSARKGTMGWHDELQSLPKRISRLVDGNFAIVYPADQARTSDAKYTRIG